MPKFYQAKNIESENNQITKNQEPNLYTKVKDFFGISSNFSTSQSSTINKNSVEYHNNETKDAYFSTEKQNINSKINQFAESLSTEIINKNFNFYPKPILNNYKKFFHEEIKNNLNKLAENYSEQLVAKFITESNGFSKNNSNFELNIDIAKFIETTFFHADESFAFGMRLIPLNSKKGLEKYKKNLQKSLKIVFDNFMNSQNSNDFNSQVIEHDTISIVEILNNPKNELEKSTFEQHIVQNSAVKDHLDILLSGEKSNHS